MRVSFCIFPLVVLTFNLPLLAIRGGIFHQELFHLLCFLYLSIAISFILLTIRGGVYLQELDCIFVLSKANPELGKNQIREGCEKKPEKMWSFAKLGGGAGLGW